MKTYDDYLEANSKVNLDIEEYQRLVEENINAKATFKAIEEVLDSGEYKSLNETKTCLRELLKEFYKN